MRYLPRMSSGDRVLKPLLPAALYTMPPAAGLRAAGPARPALYTAHLPAG